MFCVGFLQDRKKEGKNPKEKSLGFFNI